MNQGFDFYDNSLAPLHQGRDPASTTGSSARELADAAIRFLEAHQEKRFFLWVHFYDPHYAWQEHPGTTTFGSAKADLYDHEILFTDEQIGRVVARLKDLDLRDKTAIVVTADHGEGLGEHGIKMHGYHLYAAQTKVPLVIRIPGLKKRRISTPVGHIDLLPTFVNLAGGKPTRTMFGRSLLAELTGQKSGDEDREVFQEVIYEGPTERRAVVTKKWHLIYNRVPDNTFELYNLERDPGETRDVSGEKDIAERKEHLLGWLNAAEMPPESYAELAAAILKQEPKPAIAVHAEFGEAIDFLGADLEPRNIRAGEKLKATWYFQAKKQLRGNWAVIVRFNKIGKRSFSGDHFPINGDFPFAAWPLGQFIADRQAIEVPKNATPGEYEVELGICIRRTCLPIESNAKGATDNDLLPIGKIEILSPEQSKANNQTPQ